MSSPNEGSAPLAAHGRSLLLRGQFGKELGNEALERPLGRKPQLLAQAAPLVVERTDILVIIEVANSVLRKAEAEQTAKVEVLLAQLRIVCLEVIDHAEVLAIDHVLQVGQRMLRLDVYGHVVAEGFHEQCGFHRLGLVHPVAQDDHTLLKCVEELPLLLVVRIHAVAHRSQLLLQFAAGPAQ